MHPAYKGIVEKKQKAAYSITETTNGLLSRFSGVIFALAAVSVLSLGVYLALPMVEKARRGLDSGRDNLENQKMTLFDTAFSNRRDKVFEK